MNTCGTCKYKGKPATRNDECCDQHDLPYFLCQRAKHMRFRNEDLEAVTVPGLKMFVEDGSGYYAALCVEDDFGCNQLEAKP
jgi:hypothetical protein